MRSTKGPLKWLRPSSRAGWTVVDQALASLTSVLLTIVVAGTTSAIEFGGFSIGVATYLLILGIVRAVSAEPLIVRYSGSSWSKIEDAVRSATGCALLMSVGLGAAVALTTPALSAPLNSALSALAIALPGLVVQEVWRFSFLVMGRPRSAAINDAGFLFLQIGLVLVVTVGLSYNLAWPIILVWGLSAWISVGIACMQARLLPDLRGGLRWFSQQRGIAPAYVGEFLAVRGSGQLTVYAVGLVGGLPAAGALRAGQVVYGALTIVFTSARSIGQIEVVRRYAGRERDPGLLWVAIGIGAVCTVGALVYGAIVSGIPTELGAMLLGDTWAQAQEVFRPLAVWKASAGAVVGALIGLRSLVAIRRSFQARLVGGLALLIAGPAGALTGGAFGAAVGLALGGTGLAVVSWWLFIKARHEIGYRAAEREILETRRDDAAQTETFDT